MAEAYLTTDIIVIVVLLVVLILVGIFTFFIHFYWTKIGVAEIWNTTRWSSMRSSIYQTMRRVSGASSRKVATERPLSGLSAYSEEKDDQSGPFDAQGKKPNSVITAYSTPSNESFTRPNPNNPVSSIAYQNQARANYGTKIGQPMESTMIHNTHEYEHDYSDASASAQKQRF